MKIKYGGLDPKFLNSLFLCPVEFLFTSNLVSGYHLLKSEQPIREITVINTHTNSWLFIDGQQIPVVWNMLWFWLSALINIQMTLNSWPSAWCLTFKKSSCLWLEHLRNVLFQPVFVSMPIQNTLCPLELITLQQSVQLTYFEVVTRLSAMKRAL